MKTIEMKVGGKVVEFTSKSLIIDGTEYFYSKMSDIKHSASKHVYAFTYEEKVRYLQYDPKYEKGLKVIFSKINALGHKKAEAAAAVAAKEVAAPAAAVAAPAIDVAAAAPAEEAAAPAIDVAAAAPGEAAQPAGEEILQTGAEEVGAQIADAVPAVETPAEIAADVVEAEAVAPAAEPAKAPEEESVFDFPAEVETAPAETPEEVVSGEATAEVETDQPAEMTEVAADGETDENDTSLMSADTAAAAGDPAKKGSLKKSLIIFGCIIAVIGILSIIYFTAFGTADNPTSGPNSTESQQYDDIDELIEDLDN